MMWKKFLNEKVRITKTDEYVKVGILRNIEDNFVFLEYFDGRVVTIAKKDILHMEFFEERGEKL